MNARHSGSIPAWAWWFPFIYLWWMKRKQRNWKPAIGDLVLFESLAGWRVKQVVNVYPDGGIRIYERTVNGSNSTSCKPEEVIFTGTNEAVWR